MIQRTTTPRECISSEASSAVSRIGIDERITHGGWDLRIVNLNRGDIEHLLSGGALTHEDGEYLHVVVLDADAKEPEDG
jgi:hypothetical protein